MPTVSVIIPTYNRIEYLAASIASVLTQTYSDCELIIADDGSDAQTRAYLRTLVDRGIRVIELAHCGNPARVRNAALAAARGRYVAFQDSDDLWKPHKLELQLAALAADPAARWSFTASDRVDSDGRPLLDSHGAHSALRDGWVFAPLLRLEFAAAMPTILAERELLIALGGFDEGLPFGEFHDLCLRLALASPAVAVREPLCSVRVHGRHYSADRAAALGSWTRLYEKFSRLAPLPELRAHSARLRALTAARLAAHHGRSGAVSAALAVTRSALPFSWRYPRWWWSSAKTLARPAFRWRK